MILKYFLRIQSTDDVIRLRIIILQDACTLIVCVLLMLYGYSVQLRFMQVIAQLPTIFMQEESQKHLEMPESRDQSVEKTSRQNLIARLSENGVRPLESLILSGERKVKPKMFAKLAIWMQKLTTETLSFSFRTYEVALRIVLNYLNTFDQIPSNLQLLGCVALHLASKANETKIVSISSYIECCMNIFNKVAFEQKQISVYQSLCYQVDCNTYHQAWQLIQNQLPIDHKFNERWQNTLNSILLNPESYILSLQNLIEVAKIIYQNEEKDLSSLIKKVKADKILL